MVTTANPPPGATPTNGADDPFSHSTTNGSAAMRFAPFDSEQFSLYTSSSPSQARRAVEAHLKDTDRRLQDASRLGNTLVQQRKDLAARLTELEEVPRDDQIPADLRKKLAELEKEYNEIGKESARAFLPKARVSSANADPTATPSALTGSGRDSPTKVTAPSRRQRNQPTNRVHDIEFATEISTSLLAQVRQLQAALSEKDDEFREMSFAKAQLQNETTGMAHRIKAMDESEQRYKDENWNLEMRIQELESSFKASTDKEQRLTQTLKGVEGDKSTAQRELDDLKVEHEKLGEEHAAVKRQRETDLHGLRRDVTMHESEKSKLQKKVEELTAQNTELARAVSSRWNAASVATDTDFVSAEEDPHGADSTPENSEPASPVKGTPRHGMLESETLKSSLNHAHRMIQNLKNNIHREKTEKIELKRMLQDARDELEARRNDSGGAGFLAKKRRSDNSSDQFRKPARPLGANRGSTTEILDDEPDWEDHDGSTTPSKYRTAGAAALGGAAVAGAGAAYAFAGDETESTDAAFETATERDGATTDAFETGRESVAGDDSDELTETESGVQRGQRGTIRGVSPLVGARAGDRRSFQSTASTEDEADDATRTPVAQGGSLTQAGKFRLRNLKGSKRGRVDDLASEGGSPAIMVGGSSPASSTGTPRPLVGQSLGDELDGLDDGESVEGTPSRELEVDDSAVSTPVGGSMFSSPADAASATPGLLASIRKPVYADAGVMTEPWEPEVAKTDNDDSKAGLGQQAAEVIGGALAGFGLGRLTGKKEDGGSEVTPSTDRDEADRPLTVVHTPEAETPPFTQSAILSQETEPITPPPTHEERDLLAAAAPITEDKETQHLDFSNIDTQAFEPIEPIETPLVPRRSSRRLDTMYESGGVASNGIPGTDSSRPGAAFLGTQSPRYLDGSVVETEPKTYVPTGARAPFSENVEQNALSRTVVAVKKPVSDEGVQTMVSGDEVDNMMKQSGSGYGGVVAGVLGGTAAGAAITELSQSPARPSTATTTRRSIDATLTNDANLRPPRRPASAGSMRSKGVSSPPPLPEKYEQKIVAAGGKVPATPSGTMGPPLMPASAYKLNRPRTPADGVRTMSRDGTTPRPPRASVSSQIPPRSPAGSGISRRTSVSSFASEIDERFNMQRANLMYPEGVAPSTDPRMIQAITQTMIGEYLWKYTRKAGRSETSTTRHRRFFWVHPYTRTLYWSEKDPSTAGRDMLKAKSVAIEAVRVVTDDNTYPPGLHRKSLIVVTPGREIVFTAPTSQRHETWFNALSYLLLRSEQERADHDAAIDQADLDEFNPGFGLSMRRSISRLAGGRSHSRTSLSSYNSRTTRNSSPSRNRAGASSSLAQRQSNASAVASGAMASGAAGTSSSRYSSQPATTRESGRFSSITSKFGRGSVTARGRSSTMRSRSGQSGIYDASVAAESAENLRAQMEQQEEAEGARLENVRACCDGKHDVGSLSRTGRHSSFGTRFSHGHSHPPASIQPKA